MHTEKIHFLDECQTIPVHENRFEVIQAPKLLGQRELEQCYRRASLEIDPLFEKTSIDGLED